MPVYTPEKKNFPLLGYFLYVPIPLSRCGQDTSSGSVFKVSEPRRIRVIGLVFKGPGLELGLCLVKTCSLAPLRCIPTLKFENCVDCCVLWCGGGQRKKNSSSVTSGMKNIGLHTLDV